MPADCEPKKKLCFVIGPIGDAGTPTRTHADWLLRAIIKPVFATHFPDFRVERADQIVAPGSINSQVINRLWEAPLVIADMTLHNANAFYELAIRHLVRLPTIHMILRTDKIPFDVAPYRAIHFSYAEAEHLEAAKEELRSAVEEVTRDGFVVENPVTHARGRMEIEQHASPEVRVLADEMEALRARVDNIEILASLARANSDRALGIPPMIEPANLNRILGGLSRQDNTRTLGLLSDVIRTPTAASAEGTSPAAPGLLGRLFAAAAPDPGPAPEQSAEGAPKKPKEQEE